MQVKVFIRRPIREGKDREAFALLKKLRSHAKDCHGYISSETLVCVEDPQELMVISTWESKEDWEKWKESERRNTIDAQLQAIQKQPTSYRSYAFGKYRISIKKGFPIALG